MGMLDLFMPGASQYLTPDQQDSAANLGLLNASLGLIDASSNQYGLPKSPFQLGAAAVRGYGTGTQSYLSNMNSMDTTAMNQLQTQRAIQHFYPNNKAGALAGAVAPPINAPVNAAATANASPFASFYPQPSVPAPMNPGAAPTPTAVGDAAIQQGASAIADPGIQLSGPPPQAQNLTSFGVDVPTLARQMYSQGSDMSFIPAQATAGAELMQKAIAIDPTVVQSTAAATAQGQLPSELTKIGATGAQSRQTEELKAGIDPTTQPMMINGKLVNVPTTKLAQARGMTPQAALAAAYQDQQPGQMPNISGIIPAGADKNADTLGQDTGKNLAEASKTLNVMSKNLPSALDRFKEMEGYSKQASYGASEASGVGPLLANTLDNKTAIANTKINQLSAQGMLPELGPMLAQAGIRGNKFLETLSSNASALDPEASPSAKVAAIDGLRSQYIKNLTSTNEQVKALGGTPMDLAQYKIFSSVKDPAFEKLPKGAVFFDAATGKQMVKH